MCVPTTFAATLTDQFCVWGSANLGIYLVKNPEGEEPLVCPSMCSHIKKSGEQGPNAPLGPKLRPPGEKSRQAFLLGRYLSIARHFAQGIYFSGGVGGAVGLVGLLIKSWPLAFCLYILNMILTREYAKKADSPYNCTGMSYFESCSRKWKEAAGRAQAP